MNHKILQRIKYWLQIFLVPVLLSSKLEAPVSCSLFYPKFVT